MKLNRYEFHYSNKMRNEFFNLHLDILNTEETIQKVDEFLSSNQNHSVAFINAHCFNIAQKDPIYTNALKNNDIILNDGIGIRIACFFSKIPLKENMNGTDFIPKVFDLVSRRKHKVFLLGGKPGICEKAKSNILKIHPEIEIVGYNNGYYKDDMLIVDKINSSGADILIVGMGVPKQEIWIDNYKPLLNTKVCIAGGAIIDFLAEAVKRAPLWVQRIHLEWLFRMLQEPKRLWKRYMFGNITFFLYIFRYTFFR